MSEAPGRHPMRSKLFVPGSRPELFAKALAGEADAITLDLEDAVEAGRKAFAREEVGKLLQGPVAAGGKTLIVRVNALPTGHFAADLDAIVGPRLDLINLPMVESAADVRRASDALAALERARGLSRPIPLLVNIETPIALRQASAIAGAGSRVMGLQLGLADLFEPLGIDRANADAVHHVRMSVRLAAGEAGLSAYDTAFADIADPAGFEREAEAARRLGFAGKSCIHPSQVALANAVFRPTDAEIAHALRVVAAERKARAVGIGAYVVDGRMIDAPFARRAAAIVAEATRLGLVASAAEPDEAGTGSSGPRR